MVVRRTTHGVGVVFLNRFGVWALWVRGDGSTWRVRMRLDDFAAVGVHAYQRVALTIPGEGRLSLYRRGRRENPPFVWSSALRCDDEDAVTSRSRLPAPPS
jgi:hypothetical protein